MQDSLVDGEEVDHFYNSTAIGKRTVAKFPPSKLIQNENSIQTNLKTQMTKMTPGKNEIISLLFTEEYKFSGA